MSKNFKALKKSDFKDKTLADLVQDILDLKKNLFDLRFKKKIGGEIKNLSVFSKIKKNVARVKTEISAIQKKNKKIR